MAVAPITVATRAPQSQTAGISGSNETVNASSKDVPNDATPHMQSQLRKQKLSKAKIWSRLRMVRRGRARTNAAARAQETGGFGVTLQKLQGLEHRAGCPLLSLDFASVEAPALPGVASRFRVASAGQDGGVKVWAVCEQAQTCKWLATLEEHVAPVNCVRWSPDCSLIASCDADAVLLIWAPGLGAQRSVRGASNVGPEPWHRRWMLRDHGGEICDLAWHPGNRPEFGLASCSHDGTIRLWDLRRGQAATQLSAPDRGLVKGVSFDPLGHFLAAMVDTAGASNHTRAFVWQCPDEEVSTSPDQSRWQLIKICQEPWANPSPLGTAVFFRRPTWDPLGQLLCFPFGEKMRCSISTPRYFSALFARGNWSAPRLYRGHMQRVSVVRFAPLVFGPSGDASNAIVALAMGSQDGVMSIWLSSYASPVVVMTDLVDENSIITDVSWSLDGNMIAFASNDGAVGLASFDWNRLAEKQGRWSLDDVQCWKQQVYQQVTQPLLEIPKGSACREIQDGESLKRKREREDAEAHLKQRILKRQRSYEEDLRCSTERAVRRYPRKAGPPWFGFDVWQTSACTTWMRFPELQPRPCMTGNRSVMDEATRLELLIDPVQGPSNAGVMTCISLVHNSKSFDPVVGSSVGGSRSNAPRWSVVLDKRVRAASVRSDVVAVVTTLDVATTSAAQQRPRPWQSDRLLLLDTKTGISLLPSIALSARVVSMHLARDGSAMLILDVANCISWWLLSGPSAPRLVDEVEAPLAFLNPITEAKASPAKPKPPGPITSASPQKSLAPELGFLPSGMPYMRPLAAESKNRVLGYHSGMRAWIALDTWRHVDSPLQCRSGWTTSSHGAVDGALSQMLWQWRRPALPPCWRDPSCGSQGIVPGACLLALSHELALRLADVNGCAAETVALLHEFATRAAELGNTAILDEVADVLRVCGERPDVTSGAVDEAATLKTESSVAKILTAPAKLLAHSLNRQKVDFNSLRTLLEPLLANRKMFLGMLL